MDSDKSTIRGVFGFGLALGLLVFLLNAMYIRELMRPACERFEANPRGGVKFYPNRKLLKWLLVIQCVFTILGALGWITGSSLVLGAVNSAPSK